MSRTAPEEMEEKIFEIVNQLNRGTVLIDSLEERERVAELNLVAGKRAKTSTAYASALTYFVAGRALLTEQSWEQRYALTFALEFQRAECEFLTGDFAAAEERLSMLSRRAAEPGRLRRRRPPANGALHELGSDATVLSRQASNTSGASASTGRRTRRTTRYGRNTSGSGDSLGTGRSRRSSTCPR